MEVSKAIAQNAPGPGVQANAACVPETLLQHPADPGVSSPAGSANKSGVGPCRIISNGICAAKTWVMTMKYRVTPEKLADPYDPFRVGNFGITYRAFANARLLKISLSGGCGCIWPLNRSIP